MGWWKEQLTTLTESGAMKSSGVKIDGVSLSKRLVNSPCVVVTSQFGYSAHQEKIMRAQAFQNKDQIQMMAGRKTLEINGNHPRVYKLMSMQLGVDPEEAVKEIELPEEEEEADTTEETEEEGEAEAEEESEEEKT